MSKQLLLCLKLLNKVVPDILTIATAGKPGHLSYLYQVNEGGEDGASQHVVLRRLLPQQGQVLHQGRDVGSNLRTHTLNDKRQDVQHVHLKQESIISMRQLAETCSHGKNRTKHAQHTLRLRETGRLCKLFCGPAVKFGRDDREMYPSGINISSQQITSGYDINVTCIHNRSLQAMT